MKKLILCAAAMLFATMGFSQNESLIDQGKVNTADVNQASTIDMHYNFSDVYQRGENDADVDQIGENSSIVEQRGQTNWAQVNQNGGDGLSGYGHAKIQESAVYQQGKNNLASVYQVGEGNDSFVDQLNNNGVGPKLGNKAEIIQEGLNNKSTLYQENDKNWANTTQNGKRNKSLTTQKSYDLTESIHPTPSYLQGNWVIQNGEANYSNVYQNGDNQGSIITQSADSPSAHSSSDRGQIIGSSICELWTNEAYVTQNGALALSTIDQRDCEMVGANNYAEVNQTNTVSSLRANKSVVFENRSTVIQKGANTAIVNQVKGIQ